MALSSLSTAHIHLGTFEQVAPTKIESGTLSASRSVAAAIVRLFRQPFTTQYSMRQFEVVSSINRHQRTLSRQPRVWGADARRLTVDVEARAYAVRAEPSARARSRWACSRDPKGKYFPGRLNARASRVLRVENEDAGPGRIFKGAGPGALHHGRQDSRRHQAWTFAPRCRSNCLRADPLTVAGSQFGCFSRVDFLFNQSSRSSTLMRQSPVPPPVRRKAGNCLRSIMRYMVARPTLR
jgi:hypothetical protein